MVNIRVLLSALLSCTLGWAAHADVPVAADVPAHADVPAPGVSASDGSAADGSGADGSEIVAFKIYVTDTGVYRLTHEQLAGAGATGDFASTRLALVNRGREVPVWIEDGGDGRFGPGDHLEFVGEHLAGAHSYFDDYARFNVYRLSTGSTGGARMRPLTLAPEAGNEEDAPLLRHGTLAGHRHLEEDSLMVRFTGKSDQANAPELWFWTRLNHSDKAPFEIELDLRDRLLSRADHQPSLASAGAEPAASAVGENSPQQPGPVSLRVHLRGWSTTVRRPADRERLPDHLVKVWLNKTLLATAAWAGQDEHLIEVPAVPTEALNPMRNVLHVRVPKRFLEPGKPLIDAVLLNWIEVDFPHGGHLSTPTASAPEDQLRQHRLSLRGGAGTVVALGAPDASSLTVYDDDGGRFETQLEPNDTDKGTTDKGASDEARRPAAMAQVPAYRPEGQAHVVLDHDLRIPSGVAPDHPSHLRAQDQQADYLLVTVAALRDAVAPLAAFHREKGLRVAVVDVEDIYDEFNDSVTHPKAIRDFVHHAYHAWQKPSPRFVLMVGDASWDVRGQQPNDANYADWVFRRGLNRRDFLKNKSTAYEGDQDRNLVPTWRFESMQGHAASDNYFVSVDGDDFLPDLAIGRFPIATSQEATDIVTKTLEYAREGGVGPWRRRMLWITNEHESFKRRSDRVALAMSTRGFDGEKVYPSSEETDNVEHQKRLRKAFDAGQVLVHFYGHGGRYIWRTGPPDYRKNHDLFTLDDLETLEPNAKLPLVLSMSCYSAPFDHPTADSIGEKFLRLPGRGAIAVFAASWRNSPSMRFSKNLLEALLARKTIGEAILDTKQQSKSRLLIETYNLLGDPAIELALPRLPVAVDASVSEQGWHADVVVDPEGTLGKPFSGQAVIDWLDADGEILDSQTVSVDAPRFSIRQPQVARTGDTKTADTKTVAEAAAAGAAPTLEAAPATDSGVPVTVRVYVWNEAWQVDGVVGQKVVSPDAAETPRKTARLGS